MNNPVSTTPKRSSNMMWLVLAVCSAPVILSYFTYYVIKPSARTNYGTLIDPKLHPLPKLDAKNIEKNGQTTELTELKGKWIMLQIADGECDAACEKRLYEIRQLRTAQGKESSRVERVWLITNDTIPSEKLRAQIPGTYMLKVKPELLSGWLPIESGHQVSDHIYFIDPLGNLMMRYPKNADANKIKKDLSKLLKASSIG